MAFRSGASAYRLKAFDRPRISNVGKKSVISAPYALDNTTAVLLAGLGLGGSGRAAVKLSGSLGWPAAATRKPRPMLLTNSGARTRAMPMNVRFTRRDFLKVVSFDMDVAPLQISRAAVRFA